MKESTATSGKELDQWLIQLCFVLLFALNALFLWTTFAPEFDIITWLDDLIGAQRAVVMIVELLGTAVLFVDMVTRFDELHPKRQKAHVAAVAFFGVCWIFQLFVYFLDSALSMT